MCNEEIYCVIYDEWDAMECKGDPVHMRYFKSLESAKKFMEDERDSYNEGKGYQYEVSENFWMYYKYVEEPIKKRKNYAGSAWYYAGNQYQWQSLHIERATLNC